MTVMKQILLLHTLCCNHLSNKFWYLAPTWNSWKWFNITDLIYFSQQFFFYIWYWDVSNFMQARRKFCSKIEKQENTMKREITFIFPSDGLEESLMLIHCECIVNQIVACSGSLLFSFIFLEIKLTSTWKTVTWSNTAKQIKYMAEKKQIFNECVNEITSFPNSAQTVY